jgi:glycine cleavage system H protein
MSDFPENLLYNKDYSWARIENDTAVIGVIKPAADKVKEFVFIKLPKKGQFIKQGETFVSLEALKWSGHMGSPAAGEIIEVNDELFDEPAVINRDPYGQGWIAKIKLSETPAADPLLKPKEAEEFFSSDPSSSLSGL